VVVIYIIIVISGFGLACMTAALAGRTILSISIDNAYLKIKLTLLGCGLGYDSRQNHLRLFCGRFSRRLPSFKASSRKEKTPREPAKKAADTKAKSRRDLPFSTVIKIIRAGVLFAARFLSSVQYDEGQVEVKPVIANPALAGIAFGWGQAVNGAFPGLRKFFDFAPAFGAGTGCYAGRISLSVRNWRVAALVWRLLCDLPIMEIVKYRFFKKR
jgi:hypothetical protein